MEIKCRAIWADNLRVGAHIEIDMRMVGRRTRAHALEFLDANVDSVDAVIVDEMGCERLRHVSVVKVLSEPQRRGEHSDGKA